MNPLNALRASCTLCALLALYALRPLRASYADRLRGNRCILNGKGHNAVGIYGGNNNRAGQSLLAFRALSAGISLFSLRACVTF